MSEENKEPKLDDTERKSNPEVVEDKSLEEVSLEVMEEEGKEEIPAPEEKSEKKVVLGKAKDEPKAEEPVVVSQEKSAAKGKSLIWTAAAIALVGALTFGSGAFSGSPAKKPVANQPILYAKDDALYIDDLQNPPYKENEKLSTGGEYRFYYSAWGAEASQDAKVIYYATHRDTKDQFNLYRRSVADLAQSGELLAEGISDYAISKDGSVYVYLKDGVLYGNKGKGDIKLGENVGLPSTDELGQTGYQLSPDGTFVVYSKSMINGVKELTAVSLADGKPILLSGSCVQFLMAENTEKVYFVEGVGTDYSLYCYASGGKKVLIAEKVTGVDLMPNGNDIFYCTQGAKVLKWTDVVYDDMYAEDQESTEENAYGEGADVLARKEIREYMATNPLLNPMQDAYVWSSGKVTQVAADVVQAQLVPQKSGYLLYSKIGTGNLIKINLSDLKSIDELQYAYYGNLTTMPRQTYFGKIGQRAYLVDRANVDSQSVTISEKEDAIAFLEIDGMTGLKTLVRGQLDKKGKISNLTVVEKNIERAQYVGKGDTLVYFQADDWGVGKLSALSGNNLTVLSEDAMLFQVAEDADAVYFISEITDAESGGTLRVYTNGATAVVDQDVFSMQYKENGRLVYLKNYDLDTEIGDIHYLTINPQIKSNESTTESVVQTRVIDTGVSAVFVY